MNNREEVLKDVSKIFDKLSPKILNEILQKHNWVPENAIDDLVKMNVEAEQIIERDRKNCEKLEKQKQIENQRQLAHQQTIYKLQTQFPKLDLDILTGCLKEADGNISVAIDLIKPYNQSKIDYDNEQTALRWKNQELQKSFTTEQQTLINVALDILPHLSIEQAISIFEANKWDIKTSLPFLETNCRAKMQKKMECLFPYITINLLRDVINKHFPYDSVAIKVLSDIANHHKTLQMFQENRLTSEKNLKNMQTVLSDLVYSSRETSFFNKFISNDKQINETKRKYELQIEELKIELKGINDAIKFLETNPPSTDSSMVPVEAYLPKTSSERIAQIESTLEEVKKNQHKIHFSPSAPPSEIHHVFKVPPIYEQLFNLADQKKQGFIGLEEGTFLRKSGLDDITLGEVWALSSLGQPFLTHEGFYNALKLIALAQAGEKPTFYLLQTHLTLFPIPKFHLQIL